MARAYADEMDQEQSQVDFMTVIIVCNTLWQLFLLTHSRTPIPFNLFLHFQQALAQVCFFKYIVLICRIFGFITFISLMSVGIHTIVVFAQEPKTENGGPR